MCSPRPAEPQCSAVCPSNCVAPLQHCQHCLYSAGQLSTETAMASQASKAGPRLSTISLSSQHSGRDRQRHQEPPGGSWRVQGQLVMKTVLCTVSHSQPVSAGIIRKLEVVVELCHVVMLCSSTLNSKQDNEKKSFSLLSSPLCLSLSLLLLGVQQIIEMYILFYFIKFFFSLTIKQHQSVKSVAKL